MSTATVTLVQSLPSKTNAIKVPGYTKHQENGRSESSLPNRRALVKANSLPSHSKATLPHNLDKETTLPHQDNTKQINKTSLMCPNVNQHLSLKTSFQHKTTVSQTETCDEKDSLCFNVLKQPLLHSLLHEGTAKKFMGCKVPTSHSTSHSTLSPPSPSSLNPHSSLPSHSSLPPPSSLTAQSSSNASLLFAQNYPSHSPSPSFNTSSPVHLLLSSLSPTPSFSSPSSPSSPPHHSPQSSALKPSEATSLALSRKTVETIEPSVSSAETNEIPSIGDNCKEKLPRKHNADAATFVSRAPDTQLHVQPSVHLCRTQEDIQDSKQLFWKRKDKIFCSFSPYSTDIPSLNSGTDCCSPYFIEESTIFSNKLQSKCQGKDDWDRAELECDSDSGMDGCNNYPNHCESEGCCNSKRANLGQLTIGMEEDLKPVFSSLNSTKYSSSSSPFYDQNFSGSDKEEEIRCKGSVKGSEDGENRSNVAGSNIGDNLANEDRTDRSNVTVINIGGKAMETISSEYSCSHCHSKINRKLFEKRKLQRADDSLLRSCQGPLIRNSHHFVKNSDPAQKSWFITNIEFTGSARDSAMENGKDGRVTKPMLSEVSEIYDSSSQSTVSVKMKRYPSQLVHMSSGVQVHHYPEPFSLEDSQEGPYQVHILNNWERAELMLSYLGDGSNTKASNCKPTITRSHSLNSPLTQFDHKSNSELLHSDNDSSTSNINSKRKSLDKNKTYQFPQHHLDLAKVLEDRLRSSCSLKLDDKLERHHTNSIIHTQHRKSVDDDCKRVDPTSPYSCTGLGPTSPYSFEGVDPTSPYSFTLPHSYSSSRSKGRYKGVCVLLVFCTGVSFICALILYIGCKTSAMKSGIPM